jgi:hypothetical protein
MNPAAQIHAALATLAQATAEHRAHGERLVADLAAHRAVTVGLEIALRSAATQMHAADRPRSRHALEGEGPRRAVHDGAPGSQAPVTAAHTSNSLSLYCPTGTGQKAPPVLREGLLRRWFSPREA